jgi:hypothetical protein
MTEQRQPRQPRHCTDCRTCTAPVGLRVGRTLAAGALHVVSLGMSFLASRAGAHCPRCGHLPSRHRPPS